MIWRLYAAQRVLAVLCILYVAGPSDSEVELMHARQLFGNTIVIKLPSRYAFSYHFSKAGMEFRMPDKEFCQCVI